MSTEPEEQETDDEACGDNHSWEYLYSVYECCRCGETSSDD